MCKKNGKASSCGEEEDFDAEQGFEGKVECMQRERKREVVEKEVDGGEADEAIKKGKEKGKEKLVEGEGEGKKSKEEEVRLIKSVMSEKMIDLLQMYYGNAIRGNVNDLVKMKAACWAVFYHSVSNDATPQHQYGPVGVDSWCKYQCALAMHQDVPPHNTTIPPDFEPFVRSASTV